MIINFKKTIIFSLLLGFACLINAAHLGVPKKIDMVFFTKDLGNKAKSVTIHIYNGKTGKAMGSLCLKPVDSTHLRIFSNMVSHTSAIFFGATENNYSCENAALKQREADGKPNPDTHYTGSCFSVSAIEKTGIVKFYPLDFGNKKIPRC